MYSNIDTDQPEDISEYAEKNVWKSRPSCIEQKANSNQDDDRNGNIEYQPNEFFENLPNWGLRKIHLK